MPKNILIYTTGIIIFMALMAYALTQEIERETEQLSEGISGSIHLGPGMGAGIIKTDNAHLFLVNPHTLKIEASAVINPFVPPINFYIGQRDTLKGQTLQGSYRLLIVSDKDGRIETPTPGEYIGELSAPIPLGTEQYQYTLTQAFRGLPAELYQANAPNASSSTVAEQNISGTIQIAENLKSQVEASDRLVIMLFDVEQGRPVAFKVVPHVMDGQRFSIGQQDAMGQAPLNGLYSLRILTDKNQQPFHSAPGEIIGRSKELLLLGTQDIEFVLDTQYTR